MHYSNPISEIIEEYFDIFRGQGGYFVEDNRALNYFQINPMNHDLQDVLLKVREIRDVELISNEAEDAMVEHIVNLNIDGDLELTDNKLVMDIARMDFRGETRFFYSFATRYCCYHHPELYPIYDFLIEQFLKLYYKRTNGVVIEDHQLFHYTSFRHLMREYLDAFHLPLNSYWELDKFIWAYGKHIIEEFIEKNGLEQEELPLLTALKNV